MPTYISSLGLNKIDLVYENVSTFAYSNIISDLTTGYSNNSNAIATLIDEVSNLQHQSSNFLVDSDLTPLENDIIDNYNSIIDLQTQEANDISNLNTGYSNNLTLITNLSNKESNDVSNLNTGISNNSNALIITNANIAYLSTATSNFETITSHSLDVANLNTGISNNTNALTITNANVAYLSSATSNFETITSHNADVAYLNTGISNNTNALVITNANVAYLSSATSNFETTSAHNADVVNLNTGISNNTNAIVVTNTNVAYVSAATSNFETITNHVADVTNLNTGISNNANNLVITNANVAYVSAATSNFKTTSAHNADVVNLNTGISNNANNIAYVSAATSNFETTSAHSSDVVNLNTGISNNANNIAYVSTATSNFITASSVNTLTNKTIDFNTNTILNAGGGGIGNVNTGTTNTLNFIPYWSSNNSTFLVNGIDKNSLVYVSNYSADISNLNVGISNNTSSISSAFSSISSLSIASSNYITGSSTNTLTNKTIDFNLNTILNAGGGGGTTNNYYLNDQPIGAVLDYTGSSAPTNWLLCYGQAISRTTYSNLFAVVGTTYGVGDGSTTFNVPDYRGRVGAGKDDMGGSAANTLTGRTVLGGTTGSQSHTLTTAEMPSHNHDFLGGGTVGASTALMTWNNLSGTDTSSDLSTNYQTVITNTGGGGTHSNIQPTIIINKIIKYTISVSSVNTYVYDGLGNVSINSNVYPTTTESNLAMWSNSNYSLTPGIALSNLVSYNLKSATTTISISGATAPTSNQVLTAISGSNAIWATPTGGSGGTATGLSSLTTTVSVSGATAPSSNQVLTAISASNAVWSTPSVGGLELFGSYINGGSVANITILFTKVYNKILVVTRNILGTGSTAGYFICQMSDNGGSTWSSGINLNQIKTGNVALPYSFTEIYLTGISGISKNTMTMANPSYPSGVAGLIQYPIDATTGIINGLRLRLFQTDNNITAGHIYVYGYY